MSRLICLAVAAVIIAPHPAPGYGEEADATISLSWRLIENHPDGGYQAELTLHNRGIKDFGGNWELYFNSASKLLPDSVAGDVILTHVNGDFYVLCPGGSFVPIPSGQRRGITWKGTPWAINISDAPSGFYLIRDEQSGPSAQPLSIPLTIDPFPAPDKLKRGASDVVPIVDAASRYAKNESLALLAEKRLIKVVPTPLEITPLVGQFRLQRSTEILYEPTLASEANLLARALEPLLGEPIAFRPSNESVHQNANAIYLRVGDDVTRDATMPFGDESYTLTVSPDRGVEIFGRNAAGVFYGIQSLRALIPVEAYRTPAPEITIDAVRIVDGPRFAYRGLHLDVARNFHPKETVKKLLDLMAFYKLNHFHFHLTDDEGWRIEIKRLPELTAVGGQRGHTLDESEHLVPSHGSGPIADVGASPGSGFYTQQDFIEILKFAHARHITVIPELDFPGHARAAVKAMEARRQRLSAHGKKAADEFLLQEPGDASQYESVQMWRDNVVDVGRESTYRFLEVVVDELADMYRRAGVPLVSIHLGGDEVPKGAWEKSPACDRIATDETTKIPRRGQLELHFLNRASEILRRRSIQPACWDDCLLLELDEDPAAGHSRRAAGKPVPTAYVWNNVWGWGREDAAYRLANAGFDVVLCNATHLYIDLACEKDSHESGYYWAGFVATRAPFDFVPLDVFKNAERNSMGQPLSSAGLAGRTRLKPDGAAHIRGIQGQLWAENLRNQNALEYMAFPRLIALAERAWARHPDWAENNDSHEFKTSRDRDWNQFANRLGQRELPRLDYLFGGVHYRLPPPGAVSSDGRVAANVQFPGLTIRYTTDGSEPTIRDAIYHAPIPATNTVRLRTFDTRGRASRTVTVAPRSAAAD